jgi:hypothetical protein
MQGTHDKDMDTHSLSMGECKEYNVSVGTSNRKVVGSIPDGIGFSECIYEQIYTCPTPETHGVDHR